MKNIALFALTAFLFFSLVSLGQESKTPLSTDEGTLITTDRAGELDCPVNSIFSQSPVGSTRSWYSDEGTFSNSQSLFELFSGLTEDIGGITFWGVMYDGADCYTPGPMDFDVSFYQDNAGAIGTLVQTIPVNVTPSVTGSFLGNLSILRFDVTFPSSLTLASGWVSVVKKNPQDVDCTFGWINTTNGDDMYGWNSNGGQYYYYGDNVSFCLTKTLPIPVSNWAIILGVLLIGTFIVIRYRRTLA